MSKEPKSTGVEVDKTQAGCSFQSSDEGQTGWVACHDGKPPNDGDYLILPNGDLGNARYKVLKVNPQRDPMNMWIADVRHAPSTRP